MKKVVQLDADGYFVGVTVADESPLEPSVFLMPAGTIDVPAPDVPIGKVARWVDDAWVFEDAPTTGTTPHVGWVFDYDTQEWVAPTPKPDEGAVWDDTAEAWIPGEVVKAQSVRAQRDVLLRESDWTQVQDAPVDATVWATYRQALRDVPQQSGFPDEIEWPTPPNE